MYEYMNFLNFKQNTYRNPILKHTALRNSGSRHTGRRPLHYFDNDFICIYVAETIAVIVDFQPNKKSVQLGRVIRRADDFLSVGEHVVSESMIIIGSSTFLYPLRSSDDGARITVSSLYYHCASSIISITILLASYDDGYVESMYEKRVNR